MRWRSVGFIWLAAVILLALAWGTRPADPDRGRGPPTGAAPERTVRTGVDPPTAERLVVRDRSGGLVRAERTRWVRDRWMITRVDASGNVAWRWPARDAFVASALRLLATAVLLDPRAEQVEAPTEWPRRVVITHPDKDIELSLGGAVLGGRVAGNLQRPRGAPRPVLVPEQVAEAFTLERAARLREPAPLFPVGPGPRRIRVQRGPKDPAVIVRRELGNWSASLDGEARALDAAAVEAWIESLAAVEESQPARSSHEASASWDATIAFELTTTIGMTAGGGRRDVVQTLRLAHKTSDANLMAGVASIRVAEDDQLLQRVEIPVEIDRGSITSVLAGFEELLGAGEPREEDRGPDT